MILRFAVQSTGLCYSHIVYVVLRLDVFLESLCLIHRFTSGLLKQTFGSVDPEYHESEILAGKDVSGIVVLDFLHPAPALLVGPVCYVLFVAQALYPGVVVEPVEGGLVVEVSSGMEILSLYSASFVEDLVDVFSVIF